MTKHSQHVVPSGGKWTIRRAGAKKASGTFDTQREAIDVAKEKAKNQRTELYIHGQNGRIRERSSFARDPFPPKG
jgi:Uncharacterized protein conserved in bacteria (DUF2188)